MTAQTPVYGIKYLTVGEPARNTRAALQANAETIEAALVAGGVAAPGAADLLTVAGRVTTVENRATALETLPICVLRSTTEVSLPVGWTTMAWQVEDYDPDDLHSPTTNPSRVTIKRKGWYKLYAHVPTVTASTGGTLWARWKRNGTPIPHTAQSRQVVGVSANGEAVPVASPLVQLNVNDYLELDVAMTGGTNTTGTWKTFVQAGQGDGIGPMLTVECRRLLP